MIDTDKYEGHTEGPWMWYREDGDVDLVVANDQCRTVLEEVKALYSEANENLIADAPLLLAEVKRLRRAWQILRSRTVMSCVCFTEYPDNQDVNTHELMDLAMKEAIE